MTATRRIGAISAPACIIHIPEADAVRSEWRGRPHRPISSELTAGGAKRPAPGIVARLARERLTARLSLLYARIQQALLLYARPKVPMARSQGLGLGACIRVVKT